MNDNEKLIAAPRPTEQRREDEARERWVESDWFKTWLDLHYAAHAHS